MSYGPVALSGSTRPSLGGGGWGPLPALHEALFLPLPSPFLPAVYPPPLFNKRERACTLQGPQNKRLSSTGENPILVSGRHLADEAWPWPV